MAHSTASTDLVLDSDACTTTHSTLGIGLLILPLFSLSLSLSLCLSLFCTRARLVLRPPLLLNRSTRTRMLEPSRTPDSRSRAYVSVRVLLQD